MRDCKGLHLRLSPFRPTIRPMKSQLCSLGCLTAAVALLSANCANPGKPRLDASGRPINPHPPGTHEHFEAQPTYPKNHDVWKDEALLAKTGPTNSHIKIHLASQRGFLMNNDRIVMDYPVCSGVPSRPTPTGTFYILEKIVDKSSNRYGKIYDAAGVLVNGDADVLKDPIPEGGKFEGAPMRYWMRLTHDGVGHHIGPMPRSRRPASHACVRGPSKTIPIVYSKVKEGTRVVIE